MRIKTWATALAAAMIAIQAGAAPVESASGKIRLGSVVKVLYTFRDRNENTGVTPIAEAALRYLELDLVGDLGPRVSWRADLAAGNALYQDPILGTGMAVGGSGPFEFGTVGVRRAWIEFHDFIPHAALTVGTFMPPWSMLQQRSTADWGLVDLPLVYTRPEWHYIGWQNTGLGLAVTPLDRLEFSLFYINGYFPDSRANGEAALPGGGPDREKGIGGRFRAGLGPVSVFGALYDEGWEEDLKGSTRREQQHARAFIAGAELATPRFGALIEWTDLTIEHYQVKLNAEWIALRSVGGHADIYWWMLDDWQALLRWEWIDPNTANSKQTLRRSRFDQVEQWTVGVNYRVTPQAMFMLNWVSPQEEGQKVDVEAGKIGGKYQVMENNYFRVQFQIQQ
jgi:hypothetical protein